MITGKSSKLAQFQDPLINGFSRVTIRQNSEMKDRNLILKIADTVLKARTRPKPISVFSKCGDPVLESVYELLKRERYHITWTKTVILGCSAGGDVALRSLYKHLIVPHLPIIVAMHHNPGFKFMTQFEMANSTYQRIIPANDGEQILGTRIYFLPGDKETGINSMTTSFNIKPIHYRQRFRPEIDKIFSAVGIRFRENVMGVILSGMLNDGAEGAKVMALNKGEVWVQDPSSALFKEMPNSSIKSVPSARIGSIQKIAERINSLSRDDLTIEPIRRLWN